MTTTSPIWLDTLEPRQLFSSVFTPLLTDTFSGSGLNTSLWHMPTFDPGGSTFLGRTQLKTVENEPPPAVVNGAVKLTLDTFNRTQLPGQPSFYGSELITNQTFTVGTGLDVVVRAKLDQAIAGVVGGLFFYQLKPGGATHDEIDTELLGNDLRRVHSNAFANEPLGPGVPQSGPLLPRTAGVTAFHTYEMTIFPDRVQWYVDGSLIRTDTSHVPTGPVQVYVNLWAPAADWPAAFSGAIGPTAKARHNQEFTMSVDSVTVRQVRVRGQAQSAVAVRRVFSDGAKGARAAVFAVSHDAL